MCRLTPVVSGQSKVTLPTSPMGQRCEVYVCMYYCVKNNCASTYKKQMIKKNYIIITFTMNGIENSYLYSV